MNAAKLPPGLTEADVQIIRSTHAELQRLGTETYLAFYQRLFEAHPELRPLFNTKIEIQAQKLRQTLDLLVKSLEGWEQLGSELRAMGRRHSYYGVVAAHYPIVRDALIGAFAVTLGSRWTAESQSAWGALYDAAGGVMMEGAREAEAMSCETTRFFRNDPSKPL